MFLFASTKYLAFNRNWDWDYNMMSESVVTDSMSVDTFCSDEHNRLANKKDDVTMILQNRRNDQLDSSTTNVCQLEEQFLTNQLEQLKLIETIVMIQLSEMKRNQQQNEYQLHDDNKGSNSSFIEALNKLRKYHSEQLQNIQQFQSNSYQIRNDDEQHDDDTIDFLLSPIIRNKSSSMIGGQQNLAIVQLKSIIGRLDSVIETDNETDSTSLNSMVSSSNLDTIGMTQSSPSVSVTGTSSIAKTKLAPMNEYNESIHDTNKICPSDDTASKPTRSVDDDLPVTPPVTLNLSFATSHLLIQSIRKQQIAEAKREWEETTQNIRFEDDINDNDNDNATSSTKDFEHRRVYPTTPYQHKDSISDDIDDEIDDDDDSALYCATIVAKRSSNVSSSTWKGTPSRNYVTGQLPTSAQKRSGQQSSFSVLDVDVTETSSPTSTNITMDTISNTVNDISLEKESDTGTLGNAFGTTMRQLPPITTNMLGLGQPTIDEVTPKAANSMLDYFRVEPDEASPHGFRVVPCSYDKSATNTGKNNYFYGTAGSKTNSSTDSSAVKLRHEQNDYNCGESSMMSGSDLSNTSSDCVSYRKPKTYRRTPYPKKSQLETMMESPSETDSVSDDNSIHQFQCDPILNTKVHRLNIANDESPGPPYQRIIAPKNVLSSNGSTPFMHQLDVSAKKTSVVACENDKENGYLVNYSNRRSHSVMEPKTITLTPRKSLDNSFINTYQRRSEFKNGNVRMKTIRKDEYKHMSSELSQQIPLSHLQTACDAFNYAIRQQQRRSASSTHDTIGHFSILDVQRLLESFQFKDQVYQCQLLRVLHHFCRLDIVDTQEPNSSYNAKVEMMVTNDRRLSSLLQSALTVGGNRYMLYVIPEND